MSKREITQDPKAVSKAREATGLTKYAAAKRLGRARSVFTEVENGTKPASEALLTEMADLYGCPVDQLRRKPCESGGTAAEAADVDLSDLRQGQRGLAEDVLEREQSPAAETLSGQ